MDDGKEVIAKLPNPNAGPKHFTTASEVATMDFVRNVLGLPVPHVLGWSSSSDNAVGAEYVLMERCRGIELKKVWDNMTDHQKADIVRLLVKYETKLAAAKLPMFGSLYYAEDMKDVTELQRVASTDKEDPSRSRFAVGPTTGRKFFDDGRAEVKADRGPWSSTNEYLLASFYREISCLTQWAQFPHQPQFYGAPAQYLPTAVVKLGVLHNLVKIVRYLEPKDPRLAKPVIWHTDLHSGNIFVDEDDPTRITAIIDWQSVHIAPLFTQARHPAILDFDGDVHEGWDTYPIKLPENFDELSEEKAAKTLRGALPLRTIYEIQLHLYCEEVARAIRFDDGILGPLIYVGGCMSSFGELLAERLLIELQRNWDDLINDPVAEPYPLGFTEEDIATNEEQLKLWDETDELRKDFLSQMGGQPRWEGCISPGEYEAGKTKLQRLKDEFIAKHATTPAEKKKWLETWPFN